MDKGRYVKYKFHHPADRKRTHAPKRHCVFGSSGSEIYILLRCEGGETREASFGHITLRLRGNVSDP